MKRGSSGELPLPPSNVSPIRPTALTGNRSTGPSLRSAARRLGAVALVLHAGEHGGERGAHRLDRDEAAGDDERRDEPVFDRRGAVLVLEEFPEHRSCPFSERPFFRRDVATLPPDRLSDRER